MDKIKTFVTFQSAAFNTTEPGADYINSDNYGDDLARWLMERLREQYVAVDPNPGQEDFGWYLTFDATGRSHQFLLGYRYAETRNWVGWLERDAHLVPGLFGARQTSVSPEAVHIIHGALTSSDKIQDVRWHFKRDFDSGNEEEADTRPMPV